MLNYVLKRLLLVPVTLFGIALVTFTIIQLAPGDPAEMRVSPGVGGQQSADKSVSKEIYEKMYLQSDDFPDVPSVMKWLLKNDCYQLERILEKISRTGMKSLSFRERWVLKRSSRRRRDSSS